MDLRLDRRRGYGRRPARRRLRVGDPADLALARLVAGARLPARRGQRVDGSVRPVGGPRARWCSPYRAEGVRLSVAAGLAVGALLLDLPSLRPTGGTRLRVADRPDRPHETPARPVGAPVAALVTFAAVAAVTSAPPARARTGTTAGMATVRARACRTDCRPRSCSCARRGARARRGRRHERSDQVAVTRLRLRIDGFTGGGWVAKDSPIPAGQVVASRFPARRTLPGLAPAVGHQGRHASRRDVRGSTRVSYLRPRPPTLVTRILTALAPPSGYVPR